MQILNARYENGVVRLKEPAPEAGPKDVQVIFLDKDEERWEEIINDPSPRPALTMLADQVRQDYLAGKTTPMDPDKL